MKTNFDNYPKAYSAIAAVGQQSESIVYQAPRIAVQGFRSLVEAITKSIVKMDGIYVERNNQASRINALRAMGIENYPQTVIYAMELVRKIGNELTHNPNTTISVDQALKIDEKTFLISQWFLETYSDVTLPDYHKPENLVQSSNERANELEEKLEEQTAKLESLKTERKVLTVEEKKKRRDKSLQFAIHNPLSEDETREVIDQQLREAGWEADSKKITFKNTRPEKGRNLAIAEWKFPNKERADYVLFRGTMAVGIVEAKKYEDSIPGAIDQAVDYSKEFEFSEKVTPAPKYEGQDIYKVPFIFSTNGRPYLKQLKNQSGIWFWDARNTKHPRRALESWFTPEDLEMKLSAQLESKADESLKEDNDYPDLANRYYQHEAIDAVENAIREGKGRILLAMATGTGKTRTAISLMYRLIKNKRARRILYLVDRQSLAKQTANALKDNKVGSQAVSSIYGVKEFTDKIPDGTTRIQISTVQGMIKRLFSGSEYSEDNKEKVTPGMYDFIIVDEAHRGYSEDKEMSDDEMRFYNQTDYISQYRRVVDYFDAVAIGMTATPAFQTVQIFGDPVYSYSYEQGVLDGYLMDHNAPYIIKTKLSQNGIQFNKDQEVNLYNYDMSRQEKFRMPENMKYDVEAFNKQVITPEFNRVVCDELAKKLDPNEPELGKTLIFAATDDHADMVVQLLKESFEKMGNPVNDNAIMKITGRDRHRSDHIKQFKNEQYPNIVVTVDLLTTGVDVPSICNIVFLRRVKSRILYEQILGRATRKYEGVDAFNIFDPVGQYDSMKKVTDMNSVMKEKSVHRSIDEYYQLSEEASDDKSFKEYKTQLVAKLQRKIQRLDDDQSAELENVLDEPDLAKWTRNLMTKTQAEMQDEAKNIKAISEYHLKPRVAIISDEKDEVTSVTRGYGNDNERPADYLESFNKFIKENQNKVPAINLLINRPSDLKIEDLRKIQSELSVHGFKENELRSAWRSTNKVDVAASIIGFIRQAALGTQLESEDQVINRAMSKVYGMTDWGPLQKKWLHRIEEQLKKNHVLGPNAAEAFNTNQVFKEHGGYKRMKNIFGDQTDEIVRIINDSLYA